MSISDIYKAVSSIGGVQPSSKSPSQTTAKGTTDNSEFKALLDQEISLSNHAQSRIRSRQIPWNSEVESRVAKGIESAQSKGSKEALILADQVAVIANVESKTIITAMDRDQLKDRIFTNIDSAVLV